jgi:hypothetical protein
VLRDWPGWQQTVVARYRESGFESFRAFTNYEYLKDAPLKMAVPTAIGATLASIGGLFEAYATGRFTKQQVLEQARSWGLTNRRNRPLTSQAIGELLRNQLYAGIVSVPAYGVGGRERLRRLPEMTLRERAA